MANTTILYPSSFDDPDFNTHRFEDPPQPRVTYKWYWYLNIDSGRIIDYDDSSSGVNINYDTMARADYDNSNLDSDSGESRFDLNGVPYSGEGRHRVHRDIEYQQLKPYDDSFRGCLSIICPFPVVVFSVFILGFLVWFTCSVIAGLKDR